MKMKETLKFLKFGLIGVASVTTISTLTISCGKKANTNNEDTQKPGDSTKPEDTQKPGDSTKPEDTQKPDEPNNEQILEQSLNKAFENFNIKTKESSSQIYAKEITNQNIEQYVEFEGKAENFEYIFVSSKPINKTQLEVTYTIKIQNKQKNKTITLDGFRDIDSIDYDINNDFFKIALDEKHLNTIAFLAQEYNFYKEKMFKTWKLTDDPERYEATKTGQYFIFKDSKYYIWKINFKNTEGLRPIIVEFLDPDHLGGGVFEAFFTEKGAQRNPFLFAVKEK